MKKIGTLFLLLCVMNLLAIGGLAAYLVSTGRLDKPKGAAIVDLLRHKGTPVKFRETLYDILEPVPATTSAPATQTAADTYALASADLGASAQSRIDAGRQAMEQERLKLENQAQELQHRQELLEQVRFDVEAKMKKLDADKAAFEKDIAQTRTTAKDENFQKSLALYDELKAKQVKDLFVSMTPDAVAAYLQAMEPSRAGKIIGEFKSTSEATFISSVLERIRAAGTTSALAPGNSNGAPAVASRP